MPPILEVPSPSTSARTNYPDKVFLEFPNEDWDSIWDSHERFFSRRSQLIICYYMLMLSYDYAVQNNSTTKNYNKFFDRNILTKLRKFMLSELNRLYSIE
jgi:hypothetical protein